MKRLIDGLKDLIKIAEEEQRKCLTSNQSPLQIADDIKKIQSIKESIIEFLNDL